MVFLGAADGDAGAEADQLLDVGKGDVLGGDAVFGAAVVVVAERDAEGGGAEAAELVGGGLASAAGHEAALDRDVGFGGDLAEGGGGGGIEDAGFVADAEDGAGADFGGGRSELVSRETMVRSSGMRPEAASFMAPTRPTSSARVKRPRQEPSAPDCSSSMNIATMTAQPMRSSQARAWMRPSRSWNSGRSHMAKLP